MTAFLDTVEQWIFLDEQTHRYLYRNKRGIIYAEL